MSEASTCSLFRRSRSPIPMTPVGGRLRGGAALLRSRRGRAARLPAHRGQRGGHQRHLPAASTVCRSRSSWPRPGSRCSTSTSCGRASKTASTSSEEAPRPAEAPADAPRRDHLELRPAQCGRARRAPPVLGVLRRSVDRRRRDRASGSPSSATSTSSRCLDRWSTRAWCAARRAPTVALASPCCRRSGRTPPSSSTRSRSSQTRPGAPTPSTTPESRPASTSS